MLRVLLAKDLLRAWRNPVPLLINLALPLCITALVALAFGEKKQDTALGRIRVAIVDEDDSLLTGALRSAVTRQETLKHLDPLFLERSAAMRLIEQGSIAGVIAIPTNFTRHFFNKEEAVALELIKNPAQSIHPTVLEEACGAVVTAIDALARNFPWEANEKLDYKRIGNTLSELGKRFEKTNESYFAFITYESTTGDVKKSATPTNAVARVPTVTNGASNPHPSATAPVVPKPGKRASPTTPDFSIFGYLLVGMAAMFLLFIASHATTDLQRELRFRTFERYQTLREALFPFIASKVLFALVLVLICAAIMLGGGGLAFGIAWTRPGVLALLAAGYGCFGVGLMALFGALMPSDRRSSAINDVASMFLALAGGCMFPVRQLPELMRTHISPHLPTYWFVETARDVQANGHQFSWQVAFLKLTVLGLLLIGFSTWLYRRRFRTGLRA